jgi:hypothetical protein
MKSEERKKITATAAVSADVGCVGVFDSIDFLVVKRKERND